MGGKTLSRYDPYWEIRRLVELQVQAFSQIDLKVIASAREKLKEDMRMIDESLRVVGFLDLEELWRLKHLRLGFRHDLDHGDASRSTRRMLDVGNAYRMLTQKPYPAGAADWMNAQFALYDQVRILLSRVLEKLAK
jgi:hypothetical protein